MKKTIIALSIIFMATTAYADEVLCGDVTGDNEVKITDALAIAQVAVKLRAQGELICKHNHSGKDICITKDICYEESILGPDVLDCINMCVVGESNWSTEE